jgi:protein-disulfide isomerase
MICIIALVVCGILGVFSAKYRTIAKEAFDCVFKRITLRKCTTGMDKRMKSQITGKFMRKHPGLGKALYKHFESISWIFTIVLILSISYSAYSIGNFFVYGNCNGPIPDAFCIFDPFKSGGHVDECTIEGPKNEITGVLIVNLGDPTIGPDDAKVTIIEAGCFVCPYTKDAEPVVKQLISHYGDQIRFVYKDFPISSAHTGAQETAEASHCANDQGKYWEYHDLLFENQGKTNFEDLVRFAETLNLDIDQFSECLTSHKYKSQVDSDFADAFAIGVYGTPTFFINDQVLVGPKTFNEFRQIIDSKLFWGG